MRTLRSVVSGMKRLIITHIWLSSLLLATVSFAATAQNSTPAPDTVSAREDSVQQNGRGWLVALLRKIARRSDDSLATADSSDAESNAPEIAARSLATRRVFRSRK